MDKLPKRRFMSTIPGQGVTDDEGLSIPLLLVSLLSATMAFMMSISWAGFIDSSVITVNEKTGNIIPLPISRLISAIIVSGVSVGILIALFQWEKRVTRDKDEDEF